jgi:hypothetical protein
MEQTDMKEFLDAFSGSMDEENVSLYKKIMSESMLEGKFHDYETFHLSVIYPFDNFIDSYLETEVSGNFDVKFLMRESQFVERHFNKIIDHKDGFGCCADKSRTIMKRLIQFYTDGTEIVFNYEGEYTFHLPKSVFTTHDEIVEFYVSLKQLYYGNNELYLIALKNIYVNPDD